MGKKYFLFLVGLLLCWSEASFSASALDYKHALDCDGKTDNFIWYCQKNKEHIEKPPVVEMPKVIPVIPPLTPEEKYKKEKLKEFKAMQKELKDLREIAIVDPTYNNVKSYISYQLKVQKKAAVFTDVWKRAIWQTPELNYGVKHTVNNVGKQVALKEEDSEQLKTLKELSADGWGLFFFYRSTCGYCHRMAPSMKMINDNGIKVIPVSMDGKPLSNLDIKFYRDDGQSQKLGVSVTPSVYLVNTNTKLVVPVSFGIVSYYELLKRIYVIVKTKPGENY